MNPSIVNARNCRSPTVGTLEQAHFTVAMKADTDTMESMANAGFSPPVHRVRVL